MYGINILTDGQMKSELWLNNFIFQLLQLKSLLTGAFKFMDLGRVPLIGPEFVTNDLA